MRSFIPSAGVLAFSIVLFLGGSATFWLLRAHAIQSGDYEEYIEEKRYGWQRPIYHLREPGSVLLWQALAWGARKYVDGEDSFRELNAEERRRGFDLLGALSGGFFLVFLAGFLREAAPTPVSRGALATAAVFVSAIPITFIGHIEFYAPLYAGMMLYYWQAARYFRNPSHPRFIALLIAMALAVTMHRAAVFQLPALALVWVSSRRRLRWSRPSHDQIVALLVTFITLCALHFGPILAAMISEGGILVYEDYNWLPELITPLTQGWADYVSENSKLGSYHLFTFGSRAHWEHFLFFVGVASPLGLPLVLLMSRRIVHQEFSRFLMVSAVCGWAWAFVWHPHLGFGDWDLFVNPGLPTNLLAAWLVMNPASTLEDGGGSGRHSAP